MLRVVDPDGATVYEVDPGAQRVMPAERADLMNHVLQRVITDGTGTAADIGRPAAGKTGTTQDNTNAWFVGYTPQLGAAVWMGYAAEGQRQMDDVRGRAVTGGGLPSEIWQRFMAAAVDGMDTGTFTAPPDDLLQPPTSPPPTAEPTTTEPEETTTTTEQETTTTSEATTTTTEVVETTTTTAAPTTTTTPPSTTTTAPAVSEGAGVGRGGDDGATPP